MNTPTLRLMAIATVVVLLLQTGCSTLKPASQESVAATYTNPVIADDVPDPTVKKFGGYYYCFGTTGNRRAPGDRVFSTWRSADLVHWDELPGALTPPSSNTNCLYWAPEVTENNGIYYLYYAMGGIEPEHFELRVALSDHPQGPYFDSGVILKDCQTNRFTIDPFPFRDDDGQWYLFYACNFPYDSPGFHAGTGIMADRLVSMTHLAGDCHVVARAAYDWTLFQANRRMDVYDKTFNWHTIEGPCMVKHGGKYYCFYSGSNWQTPRYGVDYVVADNPLGPYTAAGDHARVLHGIPKKVFGPGGNAVITAPDGASQYIVYHAWNRDMTRRQLCIDKLEWTSEGPRATPTVTPQPIP